MSREPDQMVATAMRNLRATIEWVEREVRRIATFIRDDERIPDKRFVFHVADVAGMAKGEVDQIRRWLAPPEQAHDARASLPRDPDGDPGTDRGDEMPHGEQVVQRPLKGEKALKVPDAAAPDKG